MIIRKAVAAAAAALIAVSGPAHAQGAAKSLSLSQSPVVERASAEVEGENKLFGEGALVTLGMVAIAALIIWQGYKLIDGDEEPISP